MTDTATWDGAVNLHWTEMAGRAGRNDMPYILFHGVADRKLTDPVEIARGIEDAWTLCEWPLQICGEGEQRAAKRLWRDMFSNVIDIGRQYLLEDTPRPTAELDRDIVLYRGATDPGKTGMSWTSNFERAHWFATRVSAFRSGEGPARVWRLKCPRQYVLAKFHGSRNEDEHVVMADALASRIRIVPTSEYERLLG